MKELNPNKGVTIMLSRRFLKHAITLFATGAILFCGASRISSASPRGYRQATVKLPNKISITITIGRASKKCGGFGLCKITVGTISAAPAQRTVKAELVANDDGRLQLVLLERAPEEGGTLFIDQDIVLSRTGAQRLGFRSVTIRKGEYAFGDNKSLLNARVTRYASVTRR